MPQTKAFTHGSTINHALSDSLEMKLIMQNSQAEQGRSVSGKRLAVGYTRVSTKRQGDQGISLEAQKTAILEFAEHAEYELIEVFEEIASAMGKQRLGRRPELIKALELAKRNHAVLIVWDWSRLSREKSFSTQVLKYLPTLDYVICAAEGSNLKRASDHAVLRHAQHTGEKISERTKQGIARRKADGSVFGNPDMASVVQKLGTKAWMTSTDALVQQIAHVLRDMGDQDGLSYSDIAAILNARGIFTQQGNPWNKSRVRQPAKRAREHLEKEQEESNPRFGMF